MSFFFKHLSLSGKIEGLYREEKLSIPYKALRECCINAFCHRAYHRPGGSVGIAIYDDRVEIESSGAFPPDMTLEKLLGGHSSEPPNLIIANVLYKSELLESWGRGISLMIDECRRAGIPDPEFHTDGSSVWVVFRYEMETAGQASDKHPTSTRQAPDKYPTSIVRLIELIGEHTCSLKEMMGMMELKDRENFLGNYLNPSMEAGLVEPLYLTSRNIPSRNTGSPNKERLCWKGVSNMVKKKRKHGGHYCKVCGCHKSNESFSGRGHARHICKECQSLPKDEQADMMRCNEVERAAFRFPMRRQDWELLEKYAKKYKDRESGKFAQEMLDMKRGVFVPEEDDEEADEWNNDIFQVAETPFSELEEDTRTAMEELLEDNINEYMIHKDYIPEGKDLQDIADWVLKETNDTFYLKAVPDDAYRRLVDDTVRKMVKEWKDDGLEIKTYAESLTIMETERLIIRKITRKDMGALLALMSKPEVMYAWEHGFEKKEVHQWLNRQLYPLP